MMWLNINCLCAIYFNRNQQAFLAQMTSFAVRYDVIYHFFPINYKQLLDEVFVISGIIKVEVSVISLSLRLRLITLTETLIMPDITKTEPNNCFKENNDKRIIAAITVYFQTLKNVQLSDKQIFKFLLLEIMHYVRNLQIIH